MPGKNSPNMFTKEVYRGAGVAYNPETNNGGISYQSGQTTIFAAGNTRGSAEIGFKRQTSNDFPCAIL